MVSRRCSINHSNANRVGSMQVCICDRGVVGIHKAWLSIIATAGLELMSPAISVVRSVGLYLTPVSGMT